MPEEAETTQGTVAVADEPAPDASSGGFDPLLLGVLLLVAALVTVQNVWLRRKARRERGSASG